jgi:hypothetical protein
MNNYVFHRACSWGLWGVYLGFTNWQLELSVTDGLFGFGPEIFMIF